MVEENLTHEQQKGLALVNAVYSIIVREKNRGRKAISPENVMAEAMKQAGIE